jgi:3-oxoadipate enol-lactonase
MPYAELGDIRLYYEDQGDGEPIVFLHGFTLDHRQWKPQVEFFNARYRCIVLDSRGHGLSDAPVTGYDRASRVEDLQKFADYLKLDTFHLCGLSRGGVDAMGYAFKYQDRLKSLCLVSTGAAGFSTGNKYSKLDDLARTEGVEAVKKAWLDMSMPWLERRHPDMATLMRQMVNEHSGAIWVDPMRGKYVTPPDLDFVHTIRVPLLIVAGKYDKMFEPLAQQIHAKVPGSKLVVFPELGHMLTLEDPGEFNALYLDFLQSLI